MKILLISPLGFAINENTKYAGIERLVWEYARELVKTHQVTVMGHAQSVYAEGVSLLGTEPKTKDIFLSDELQQYQEYGHLLGKFDVIHDFSHQHFASKLNFNLPSLNIFWHAPSVAKYPKSPYNIIALSEWAKKEFEKVYQQKARYQQSIVIDSNLYKPNGKRGDRFLSLGMITPRKGHLEALKLCKEAGVPLDVVGKIGDEEYAKQVHNLAETPPNRFLGEISESEKVTLYQSAKALIYSSQEAEVTNHKLQEAMLTGCPVIVSNIGAMPEIVSQGIDGYLCSNDKEFLFAIQNVDKLNISITLESNREKYDIAKVVFEYINLYESVAKGLRW